MSRSDRRLFLRQSGLAVAALAMGACDGFGSKQADAVLRLSTRGNERLERWLSRRAGLDRGSPGVRTAGDAFPSYYISDEVPVWDATTMGQWRLDIVGLVARPARLSFDDLLRLPRHTQRVNHFCVEGWTAVVEFTGVRMRDLVAMVQPAKSVGYVDFESFDSGYHESWDLDTALHPQTMIVIAKDGQPLSPAYGAPARVHSPLKLGYKNTKYLRRITLMPAANGGYWSDNGYEWFGGT